MTPSVNLWEQFCTEENFLLAWQRLTNVTSRIVGDELGMEVFAFNIHENIRDLVRRVNDQNQPYQPLSDHKVYVPKPSMTMRTMSMMSVPDLVVYHAIVNVIAKTSHYRLVTHENQHVWGNLYAGANSPWMLRPWKSQYNKFVAWVVNLYKAGNHWIASTDIVSFYDTIDHEILTRLIKKYCGEDDRFVELFKNCLTRWSSHSTDTSMSRGIPQGSNASDYLANLYLYEIDQHMIARGHQYVRYVDDVRILGGDKVATQQGLIDFDLELKKYGLVAQVTKTSVHEIRDIAHEISSLKFRLTDPADDSTYQDETHLPQSEQAESVREMIAGTPSESVDLRSEAVQNQLYELFIEAFSNLDNTDKGKEADRQITFCLNRLFRRDDLREEAIELLDRIPWRSEPITQYLALFEGDFLVAEGLRRFVCGHKTYYWHRANALRALRGVCGARAIPICRKWLSDELLEWYPKMVAARLLQHAPGQHSIFVECLRNEQRGIERNSEEGAILRQQLAFSAFHTAKSKKKQMTLFGIILNKNESPLLRRLAIYLLQLPECKVEWGDLSDEHHSALGEYADLIRELGISQDVPKPCYILQTLGKLFDLSLHVSELWSSYGIHYDKAVEHLRRSVQYFYASGSNNDNAFVSDFHKFAHLTLVAFYQHVLPSVGNPMTMDYGNLWQGKQFKARTPKGNITWEELGELRNRVDHPIDRKTRLHSQRIAPKEADMIKRQLKVAIQELFDEWVKENAPFSSTAKKKEAIRK